MVRPPTSGIAALAGPSLSLCPLISPLFRLSSWKWDFIQEVPGGGGDGAKPLSPAGSGAGWGASASFQKSGGCEVTPHIPVSPRGRDDGLPG